MADVVCLGELLIDLVPTVSGTSLIEAPAFQKAQGEARANGAPGLARPGAGRWISADPDLRLAFRPGAVARAGLHPAIGRPRIARPSENALGLQTGTDVPRAARAEPWHETLELTMITRGSGGCVYLTRTLASAISGFRVEAIAATCRRRRLPGRSFAWVARQPGRPRRRAAAASALAVCQSGQRSASNRARRAADRRAGPELARPPASGARYAA